MTGLQDNRHTGVQGLGYHTGLVAGLCSSSSCLRSCSSLVSAVSSVSVARRPLFLEIRITSLSSAVLAPRCSLYRNQREKSEPISAQESHGHDVFIPFSSTVKKISLTVVVGTPM